MKSEAAETDRPKIGSRQPAHRRKMSKNSSAVVNGADESSGGGPSSYAAAAEDESASAVVRQQINLAAAIHDHLSCTKSAAELCKVDGGSREPRTAPLPCETDHIYANCGERKNKSAAAATVVHVNPAALSKLTAENKKLRNLLIMQMDLIKQLEHELMIKNKLIKKRKRETLPDPMIVHHLDRKERMSVLRNHHKSGDESIDISQASSAKANINLSASMVTSTTAEQPSLFVVPGTTAVDSEQSSTIPSVNLVTRYFGRRSKTIPSRALKRRYLGPPKTIPPFKKPAPISLSSATSVSSESEVHEDEILPKAEVPKESKPLTNTRTSLIDIKRIRRKRGKRPKGLSRKLDFLTTDKIYFLPDNRHAPQTSFVCNETIIDVPSWKLKPVTSFYQMEGTENINDAVFQRRHLKYEQDERRRKRWDIQRLREQKASEKLKNKYCKDAGKEDPGNSVQQKSQSFYPDPCNIQYIQVTDQLPVLAFGHLIPLFQPSEFSVSWKCNEGPPMEPVETFPNKVAKRSRLSITGPKIT